VLAVLAILAALAILFAPADSRATLTRLGILTVGIVLASWLFRRSAAVTRATPERFEVDLRKQAAVPAEIASLRAIDNTVRLSTASAFGVELRLKPLIRELAAWRLMRHRGIDMAATPEAARRVLGESLWHLTQAADDRPDNGAPGLPLAELRASLDQLERI
jgi:hypothetical protein